MDPLLELIDHRGFFTRADARDAGYDDRIMADAVRSRIWHRIRRGYYTYTELVAGSDDLSLHRLRARCVLHSLGPGVALSHISGAIEHGIATWGLPLDRVHVTRLDGGAGRIEGDVVHHVAATSIVDVVDRDGVRLLEPGRCALECAILGTAEVGLVHLDSVLHLGLETAQGLMRRFRQMERWPRTQHLHLIVRMADAGSQSVGESRGKWLFLAGGVPSPQTQYEVVDATGTLIGTCDWGWPKHGLLGEFDGRQKYGRILKPGQDPGEVVFAEKRREDLIREATGMAMVRLVWSDLERPRTTVARIERLMRRTG